MEENTRVEQFRQEIVRIPEAFEDEPSNWWRSSAKLLFTLRRNLEREFDDTELVNYYDNQIEHLLGKLRDACNLPISSENQMCAFTDSLIMDTSARMAQDFEVEIKDVKTNFISIEDLIKTKPDRFSITEINMKGHTIERLDIARREGPEKDYVYLPPTSNEYKIYHKGGPPRYVLDIVADAPYSMQDAEVPFNDFDIIFYGSAAAKEIALLLGADIEGIEFSGHIPKLNFPLYAMSRDTTQNQVLLGAEGLYYTDAAFNTAKTGKIELISEYIARRAIYGIDHAYVEGVKVATPRGQMRCLKALAEGKAIEFPHTPISSQFEFGIYALFLSKKWAEREDFPVLLDKMFYILKQMGHIKNEGDNIFETLERIHKEYPFFDYNSEVLDPTTLVRWKIKKLVRQLDREMRWRSGIQSLTEIERSEGDLIPKSISMHNYKPNTSSINAFSKDKWEEFLKRCELRRKEFNESNSNETLYNTFFDKNRRNNIEYDSPFDNE